MPARNEDSPIQSFLNPESMLTPGFAGALVMMITNALAVNLELTGQMRTFAGMALSFVVGLLVLSAARQLWLRGVYYVLNSLIIFAVAFGSANLINTTQKTASLGLTSAAFAQTPGNSQSSTCEYLKQSRHEAHNRGDARAVGDLDAIIGRNCGAAAPAPAQRQFFAPWK